jgi:TatD DNase family protein
MKLFDTHCHLQDPAFHDVDRVIERASAAGVEHLLVCGYDLASSERALELSERHPEVLAGAGVHPHDARDATPTALDRIGSFASDARCAAVGEIGLDFYRDLSPRDVQLQVLAAQLDLAVAVARPVSVHSRGAEEEIHAPLADFASRSSLVANGQPPGVMHCFGGTVAQARRFVDLGFLVSVPCTVTYPNNDEGRRIATELPLESLVVETDSPYLPPQGLRGKRNEPANVAAAVRAIAALRGISVDEVAAATTANAMRVFRPAKVAAAR